jgi:hypothetical protein
VPGALGLFRGISIAVKSSLHVAAQWWGVVTLDVPFVGAGGTEFVGEVTTGSDESAGGALADGGGTLESPCPAGGTWTGGTTLVGVLDAWLRVGSVAGVVATVATTAETLVAVEVLLLGAGVDELTAFWLGSVGVTVPVVLCGGAAGVETVTDGDESVVVTGRVPLLSNDELSSVVAFVSVDELEVV